MDLDDLRQKVVFLTGHQAVDASVVSLFPGFLSTSCQQVFHKLFNDYIAYFPQVDKSVFFPRQVFAESLSVRNNLQTVFLNGVNLAHGYLTISTDQMFNVNFTLSSAHATHVEVGGLVNSWNLQQEWNRTLMVRQTIGVACASWEIFIP